MYNRIANQFEGFLNTLPIFKNSNFIGFALFKGLKKNPGISSNSIVSKEFPKNLVLGKRVEHFFSAAIEASPEYQLIANNIQISDENRTLGEFDFILRELKTSKILHVEVMYKFYVYDPDFPTEMERWIGPNRKDSLLQKIEKVKTNQFPLLHTSEAKKYLSSLDLSSEDIEQQLYFKATMFIPEKLMDQEFPNINKQSIAGHWYHLEDFNKYKDSGLKFYAPEKQDWPIDPKFGEIWMDFEQISAQIKELHLKKKSPLIWVKKPNEIFERLIVVWW